MPGDFFRAYLAHSLFDSSSPELVLPVLEQILNEIFFSCQISAFYMGSDIFFSEGVVHDASEFFLSAQNLVLIELSE